MSCVFVTFLISCSGSLMVNEFEKYGYLDDSTKNAVLPMFLSYDANILYRSFEEAEKWSNTDYSKPEYVRLNDSPTQQNISFSNRKTGLFHLLQNTNF